LQLSPLTVADIVVDENGRALQKLRLFTEDTAKLPILVGTGSPEGVIEAKQTRLYMNDAGTTGTLIYIKQFDDIAGNRKMGWVLI
jgi:hypothetical protein